MQILEQSPKRYSPFVTRKKQPHATERILASSFGLLWIAIWLQSEESSFF
jgi:hypothetical protein